MARRLRGYAREPNDPSDSRKDGQSFIYGRLLPSTGISSPRDGLLPSFADAEEKFFRHGTKKNGFCFEHDAACGLHRYTEKVFVAGGSPFMEELLFNYSPSRRPGSPSLIDKTRIHLDGLHQLVFLQLHPSMPPLQ